MKNDHLELHQLSDDLYAKACHMAEDELRLESPEVTAKMMTARAKEYTYLDTPEALRRELKPEFSNREKAASAEAQEPVSTKPVKKAAAPADADETEKIERIPLDALRASPFNPRGVLNETEMEQIGKARMMAREKRLGDPLRPQFSPRVESLIELAATMTPPAGILQPLIVRAVQGKEGHEIVAGHRRWYAAQIAELGTVPVIVRPVADAIIVELMLIENLQREDLNPLEEARGVESLLQLTDEQGRNAWTVGTVAAKIGRSEKHVFNTRRILRVPAKFHAKIEDGSLPRTICYLIAAIPDPKLRAQAATEIVKGDYHGPFTKRAAKEHIRRNYMVELRGTPFDPRDAELVPVKEEAGERVAGGACDTCPLNSANRKDDDDEAGHITMCMNPACYQAKVDAHVRSAMQRAEAAGDKLVTGAAAKKLMGWDGNVLSGTGKVKLTDKPTGEIIGGKKAPTWGKMLAGEVKAEVTTVIDEKGRVCRMVDRGQAIEAAQQNGFKDLFVAGAAKKSARTDEDVKMKERRAKELAESKLETATACAWMDALVVHVAANGVSEQAWRVMLELAIGHAGADGRRWVINRRAIEMVKTKSSYAGEQPDLEATLKKHAALMKQAEISALVVELLLAQGMRWDAVRDEAFLAMLKAGALPLAAIEQRVKVELAEKKKPKKGEAVDGAGLTAAQLKELAALSLQLFTLIGERAMSVPALQTFTDKTLGRRNKVHVGSKDNHWHAEDYRAVIEALKKEPVKGKSAQKGKATKAVSKPKKPAKKKVR